MSEQEILDITQKLERNHFVNNGEIASKIIKQLFLEVSELKKLIHNSDCAIYNEPAYTNGECNCLIEAKVRGN